MAMPQLAPRSRLSVRLLLTLVVLCHASCREDGPTSRPASVDNEVRLVAPSRPTSEREPLDNGKAIVMDELGWPASRDWPASREASPESEKALVKEIRFAVAQYLADHPEVLGNLRQSLQEVAAGTDATGLGRWSLSGSKKGRLYGEAYWIGNEHHLYVMDLTVADSGVRVSKVWQLRERVRDRNRDAAR